MNVVIVDLGFGNVASVESALRRIDVPDPVVSGDVGMIARADRLILPGVGSFDVAMQRLADSPLRSTLEHRVREIGVPILGICLGMQIYGSLSEEGRLPGLGWIPAVCRKFPSSASLKVPHIGWQALHSRVDHPLFEGIDPAAEFYFVHSYFLDEADDGHVLARTDYGSLFPSVVQHENIVGTQFHLERSHAAGHRLLRNFLTMWRPA